MHNRYDTYSIFQEPVTEESAPGYFDVITRPMDFGSMRKKVIKGNYGKGSKAAARYVHHNVMYDVFINTLPRLTVNIDHNVGYMKTFF